MLEGGDIVGMVKKRAEIAEALSKETRVTHQARASNHAVQSLQKRYNLTDLALERLLKICIEKGDVDKALEIIERIDGLKKPTIMDNDSTDSVENFISSTSQLTGL